MTQGFKMKSFLVWLVALSLVLVVAYVAASKPLMTILDYLIVAIIAGGALFVLGNALRN